MPRVTIQAPDGQTWVAAIHDTELLARWLEEIVDLYGPAYARSYAYSPWQLQIFPMYVPVADGPDVPDWSVNITTDAMQWHSFQPTIDGLIKALTELRDKAK